MQHAVGARQQSSHRDGIAYVGALDVHARVASMMREIFFATCREVIDHDDLAIIRSREAIDDVASDEASPARNHDATHQAAPFLASTAGIVWTRIARSNQKDRRATYSRSRRNICSRLSWLRPRICQSPVIPG